jgi:hypothetical protein
MMSMSLSLAARQDSRGNAGRGVPRRRSVKILAVGSAVAGVLVLPAVAYAEGSFNSYLSHVADGYTSRRWTDNNLDAAGTTTYVAGCSRDDGATFLLKVELRKDQFGPDKSYGTVDYSGCTSSGLTYNWGRVGSGTFFDQIHQYSFGTLSASSFNVGY